MTQEQAVITRTLSYSGMTTAQLISEARFILAKLGKDNIVFRLCDNLLDYAQSGKRNYKPFESVIRAFARFEKTL